MNRRLKIKKLYCQNIVHGIKCPNSFVGYANQRYCKDCRIERKKQIQTKVSNVQLPKNMKKSILALSFQHLDTENFIKTFDKIIDNEINLIISR